jgi:hydrogenase 3 maturation protease
MPDLIEYLRSLNENSLIMGVGNPLRGDDGFGPALIAELSGKTRVRLLDAEETPEAFLGRVTEMSPDKLLIADVVAFGGAAGEAVLLEPDQLGKRIAISTHNLPLVMFIRLFKEKCPDTDVKLLGVQPGSIEMGQGLGPAVRRTVEALARMMTGKE